MHLRGRTAISATLLGSLLVAGMASGAGGTVLSEHPPVFCDPVGTCTRLR